MEAPGEASAPWWPWAVVAGLAALIAGGLGVVAYKMTRSIRNKNPGNLRPLPSGIWDGETSRDVEEGGPFSVFSTPFYGWRAMVINVYGHIRKGQDSIRRLIEGSPEKNYEDAYAPGADQNDVDAYVDFVSKAVALSPDAPLNIYLHGPALVKAIASYENGFDPALAWTDQPRLDAIDAAIQHLQQQGLA